MRRLFDDARHDDRREIRAQRDELVDGRNVRRDQVAQTGRGLVERDERAEPLVRNVHSEICSRNLMSES